MTGKRIWRNMLLSIKDMLCMWRAMYSVAQLCKQFILSLVFIYEVCYNIVSSKFCKLCEYFLVAVVLL